MRNCQPACHASTGRSPTPSACQPLVRSTGPSMSWPCGSTTSLHACNPYDEREPMTENAVSSHLRDDLSIDQKLALNTAATRLHAEFADMFGAETIERFLHSSYDQFAARASVPRFLPLLAE